MSPSNLTVLLLVLLLLALVTLLIYCYKRLNREANGEYTIRRMVYKERGLRDTMRGAALALGVRLGVQLWPHSDADGEEMQDIQNKEARLKKENSQEGYSEEGESEEEDHSEQCGETKDRGGDTSDDNSSLESSEAVELITPSDQPEANREMGEKEEEQEEKVGDGADEADEGPAVVIDLNQFSGGVIWYEEGGTDCDITSL